ncbi:MAG: T9SS type B sorting domain-containing protein [Bacteroidota bacterium]
MKKNIVYLLLLLVGMTAYSQGCPQLLSPIPGTTVPVESTIIWEEIPGVPGYFIRLGTSPRAGDILPDEFVGGFTSYTPPLGLPEDTTIFVTITLFFFDPDFDNIECPSTSFRTETLTTVPDCTTLRFPENNSDNVNIRSNISWNYAPGATGYTLNVSTGDGTIIENNLDVGNVLTYNPMDFNTNEEILVQVIPNNRFGSAINCPTQRFITADIATQLDCTSLIGPGPVNGDSNVPLTPVLSWEAVPGATAYLVSIGTSPFENDILVRGRFNDTSTIVLDFDPNSTLFVTITPINDLTEALNCPRESFSTAQGCGPFINRQTGELISLFPELEFPDALSLCENALPATLSTDAIAETFRWTRTTQAGTVIEELSQTRDAEISEAGFYRLEAFNFADPNGNNIPCPAVQEFRVDVFPGPTITSIDVEGQGDNLQFVVNVTGDGTYEYALNNMDGPYQSSNVFNNVSIGNNTVFVRDVSDNSCIVSELVEQDLISEGFPNFFTPNGDGINDFWQFMPPPNALSIDLAAIFIFNRFGQLIAQIDPSSQGWNGMFNGSPLPATDYWFKAIGVDNRQFSGHFTLKR